MSFYKITDKCVKLYIKASPSASKNEICSIMGDALKIKIAAPPVDGKANEELVRFLSKQLKIAKSEITIALGESGKHKCVLLPLEVIDKIKEIENGKN